MSALEHQNLSNLIIFPSWHFEIFLLSLQSQLTIVTDTPTHWRESGHFQDVFSHKLTLKFCGIFFCLSPSKMFGKLKTGAIFYLIPQNTKSSLLPHHIFCLDRVSLDDSFLDVGAGSGDAVPGQRFLLLPLGHVVRQEVKLDCNTAHALLDLPTSNTKEYNCVWCQLASKK